MTTTFEDLMTRVDAGERLPADALLELAGSPDILQIGMLADAMRRRLRGTTVTYVRVAHLSCAAVEGASISEAAREVHLTDAPAVLADLIAAIHRAKALAGDRRLCALSWAQVEHLAAGGGTVSDVLAQLRQAGLDAISELPLDAMANAPEALDRLTEAGFGKLRLTIDHAAPAERWRLMLRAAELQDRFACIQALSPLPSSVNPLRPGTGYDDVKSVAMARLAAPNVPTIQVNWRIYGPKLAQVALTFGADDLDEVTASDDAPEGRRRAPLEDVRRNIEAAGFTPAERDGGFALLS